MLNLLNNEQIKSATPTEPETAKKIILLKLFSKIVWLALFFYCLIYLHTLSLDEREKYVSFKIDFLKKKW